MTRRDAGVVRRAIATTRASVIDLILAARIGPFRYGSIDAKEALFRGGSRDSIVVLGRAGGFIGVAIGVTAVVSAPAAHASMERTLVIAAMGVYAIVASVALASLAPRLPLPAIDALGVTGPIVLAVGGVVAGRSLIALPFMYAMFGAVVFAHRHWTVGVAHLSGLGLSYALVVAMGPGHNAPVTRWAVVMASTAAIGGGTRWLITKVGGQVLAAQRARAEVDAANGALEAANDDKSAFLARMSHELRTPLNGVVGFADVVREGLAGPLTDRQRAFIDDVASSGRELIGLVDEALDLDRVESGRIDLDVQPISLVETARDVARLVEERATRGGVALELDLSPATPVVHADARKLRQVIRNLLVNAVRFTDRGGVIYLSVHPNGDGASVVVSDTGVGIAESDLERVFEPYEQVGEVNDGTGLGLPLARRFIERHGGSIHVTSALDQGTTIGFDIPSSPPEYDPVAAALAESPSPSLFIADGSREQAQLRARFGTASSALAALLVPTFVITTPTAGMAELSIAVVSGVTALASAWLFGRLGPRAPYWFLNAYGAFGVFVMTVLVWHSGRFSDLTPLGYAVLFVVHASLSTVRRSVVELGVIGVAYGIVLTLGPSQSDPVVRWVVLLIMLSTIGAIARWIVNEQRCLAAAEASARTMAELIQGELAATAAHKRDFVAGMSHELRSPLNTILGFTEVLLADTTDPLSDRQRQHLREVQAAGRHLLSLIDDILDLAKLESGRAIISDEEFDIDASVRGAIAAMEGEAQGANVDLKGRLDPDLGSAHGDPAWLHRVIIVLLTNAIKFTPAGGEVELAAAVHDDALEIAISDTGVGIAPDQISDIFEPFRRATRPVPQTANEGPGVGLALAHAATDALGGRITVTSEVGSGSRFVIHLPQGRFVHSTPGKVAVS